MFHIPSYGKWNDIMVFSWAGDSYLLQGKKCLKCLATKFRIVGVQQIMGAECKTLTEEHLIKCGLWQQPNGPAVKLTEAIKEGGF